MTKVQIRIASAAPQELLVRATGRDLALIEGNAPAGNIDNVMPDPVLVFADRVGAGFFPGTNLRVGASRFDPRTCEQVWTLSAQSLEPGALRVLVHLLLARSLKSLAIQTRSGPAAAMIEAVPAAYPPAPTSPGFRVERGGGGGDVGEGRLVRIELTRSPTDEELGELYALLEGWVDLLLLGGFPAEGKPPSSSGVLPALAVLIEPAVIEQHFDGFYCHEDAFHAVLAAVARWHARRPVVRRLVIS